MRHLIDDVPENIAALMKRLPEHCPDNNVATLGFSQKAVNVCAEARIFPLMNQRPCVFRGDDL
ncbi:MAG: hypothetical protein U0Z53_09250 [Blastocatellia bacterium]